MRYALYKFVEVNNGFISGYINRSHQRTCIDALPKSLILLGEFGSGKHLISEYISSKFNLTSIDITNDLTYDTLEDITFK